MKWTDYKRKGHLFAGASGANYWENFLFCDQDGIAEFLISAWVGQRDLVWNLIVFRSDPGRYIKNELSSLRMARP